MIHLVSSNEVVKNMIVLGSSSVKERPKSLAEVEENYHEFISDYQPEVPRLPRLGTQLIDDQKMEEELTELYRTDALLNDRDQSKLIGSRLDREVRGKREALLRDALAELKRLMPESYQLFQLAIDSLFLRDSKSSGGGSTSNAMGVIWINSRDHWKLQDLVELLIHELTHNLVFMDELRYLHFKDYRLLQNKENFAKSAILHTARPIDKVFHSIMVSVEVLIARDQYLGEMDKPCVHPESPKMLSQTIEALHSLKRLSNFHELLTERGIELIDICEERLFQLSEAQKRSA